MASHVSLPSAGPGPVKTQLATSPAALGVAYATALEGSRVLHRLMRAVDHVETSHPRRGLRLKHMPELPVVMAARQLWMARLCGASVRAETDATSRPIKGLWWQSSSNPAAQ
ncbi:uncharacterized protein BDZ99DRAFT_513063 [Mytilinidion resinicola]|uniref:Uncharacterized protein n=1 Tax=Mytilinidion resinicola TaxID=574789 RepID=A0A6A6Z7S6_9PEZI|nr:uncharacterized protein BDZ99DRAFT_513063 [Mytilinidion resinicola]KAF2816789.1 hypothetical protein BDZ99DRAFT_513063 [Mytilinidion resinicola]